MDTASLVIIEWEDSRQPSGEWTRLSGFTPEGICQCVSVGFLVYDGDDYKSLAPNMADVESDENMQASGFINIPTTCVKKITQLEEISPISAVSDQEPALKQTQQRS